MSIAVAASFPRSRPRALVESQLIVDESWALSGRSGSFEWPILFGAGLLLYVLWIASTAVGTLVGSTVADPKSLGLDAAFAALPRTRRAVRPRAKGGDRLGPRGRHHPRSPPGRAARRPVRGCRRRLSL